MPNKNIKSQEALNRATEARKRSGNARKIIIASGKEAIARRWGNGSLTDGIDQLFTMLPVFVQAKTVIELSTEHLPPEKRVIAEAVLFKLEELEIELAYEQLRAEGDLPSEQSSAWIV